MTIDRDLLLHRIQEPAVIRHHPDVHRRVAPRAPAGQLAFGMIVGASAQAVLPASPERRYALREIKARLHQATFRDAVLSAYEGRCAISLLPESRLLDAAHIVMDADEQLGQPIVSNGLPKSCGGPDVSNGERA
jgi:hypothetical protein